MRRPAPVLLCLAALLAGCAAGKAVVLQPQAAATPYRCGPYSIQPDSFFADGLIVIYYLLPMVVSRGDSSTASQLELAVTIEAEDVPIADLTTADVAVLLPDRATPVSPTQVSVKTRREGPGQRRERKTFRFRFDLDRHRLSSFSLLFPRPVQGCTLPATPYVRQVERHYATPVNR